MKKSTLSLLALLVGFVSFAQVTIEKENLPEIGESYLRDTMFKESNNWDDSEFIKVADANPVTFDFSWLTGGNFDTVLFYNPDTSEFSTSFPDADIAMQQDLDFLMEIRDTGLFVQGMSIQGQVAKFDTALQYLPTPLSLGTSYYSKGSTVLSLGFAQIYVDYERSLNAINSGNAKMPNDSVYDVLILDIENNLSFIVVTGTDTVSTFNEKETVYEFYAPEFGYPIIRGIYDANGVQEAQFLDLSISTGLGEMLNAKNVDVFPNPSNGNFIISSTINVEQVYLFDASGKMVFQRAKTGNEVKVDGLVKGIYHLLIMTDKGVASKEILVE
ncbi:MAG: T9SS type A sorting domain-containing protein [Bacteroidia bacterium]